MTLSNEDAQELKSQLKSQVQNLPAAQKEAALQQIDSLSNDALEAMLEQQKERSGKSIFRMIANKETESIYVGENEDAVAVLDINPISKGHTLIIPKNAVKTPKDIPKSAFALAEEVSKKIIDHLKAKSTKAETDTQFGEAIIHLIPIYDKDLNTKSPRSKASPSDLEEIKKSLETIKIEKKVEKLEKPKKPRKRVIKLQRRIP